MNATLRVVRYIKKAPGLGLLMPAKENTELIAYCDSDWGACLETRSGGGGDTSASSGGDDGDGGGGGDTSASSGGDDDGGGGGGDTSASSGGDDDGGGGGDTSAGADGGGDGDGGPGTGESGGGTSIFQRCPTLSFGVGGAGTTPPLSRSKLFNASAERLQHL
ncbi:glycine-rich protein DOT1-like [Solanum stenotomum]|uniref:glycine-rich protein DOT1-like n=1 Tax=Solanum stenotomum TaxID=172797 RepID=UPI0020D00225|nr:glycine-rich protein DOT1-like [Solanum stenotomum]